MFKISTQKLILSLTAVIVCTAFSIGFAAQNNEDSLENLFDPNPTTVDLANNPKSLTGYYEIDRVVIHRNDTHFLDTEDDYIVDDHRGEASIKIDTEKRTLGVTFKHQMKGEAFTKDAIFEPYGFIFYDKTIRIPTRGDMEEAVSKLGLHLYDKQIVWELPSNDGISFIVILKKQSDEFKNVPNSKYLFL